MASPTAQPSPLHFTVPRYRMCIYYYYLCIHLHT
jgi:hypothetical protein